MWLIARLFWDSISSNFFISRTEEYLLEYSKYNKVGKEYIEMKYIENEIYRQRESSVYVF